MTMVLDLIFMQANQASKFKQYGEPSSLKGFSTLHLQLGCQDSVVICMIYFVARLIERRKKKQRLRFYKSSRNSSRISLKTDLESQPIQPNHSNCLPSSLLMGWLSKPWEILTVRFLLRKFQMILWKVWTLGFPMRIED